MAKLILLKQCDWPARLPAGVGDLADLAYVSLAQLQPQGLGATPRRKPRGKPRPAEDVAYNTAFAKRRVRVENSILWLRRYEVLSQTNQHQHGHHTQRVVAIAGLINRQIDIVSLVKPTCG